MARAADYFDRARSVASAIMMAAGAAAIIGSVLDWVSIEPPPVVPDAEATNVLPYSGLEAGDGWWVVALAALLIASAVALAGTRRRGFAQLAFLACIVLGGIAIADVRAVGDIQSGISDRMNVVGEPDPALGILLVAAAAIIGFFGALAALAASPRVVDEEPEG